YAPGPVVPGHPRPAGIRPRRAGVLAVPGVRVGRPRASAADRGTARVLPAGLQLHPGPRRRQPAEEVPEWSGIPAVRPADLPDPGEPRDAGLRLGRGGGPAA